MNLNRVMLGGNLTRDPALKFLTDDKSVCEFGIAVNRKFKTAAGDLRDEPLFVECCAFGKTGIVIEEHFKKGKSIYVEGRLKYDTWEDKSGGGKRSKLSVVVESFQFVGGPAAAKQQPASQPSTSELKPEVQAATNGKAGASPARAGRLAAGAIALLISLVATGTNASAAPPAGYGDPLTINITGSTGFDGAYVIPWNEELGDFEIVGPPFAGIARPGDASDIIMSDGSAATYTLGTSGGHAVISDWAGSGALASSGGTAALPDPTGWMASLSFPASWALFSRRPRSVTSPARLGLVRCAAA